MLPASGRSKPAIMRRQVVFPEPDGPSRVKNSPRRMSRSTPSTATTSPNSLRTPTSLMSGVWVVSGPPVGAACSVTMSVFYRYWPTRCMDVGQHGQQRAAAMSNVRGPGSAWLATRGLIGAEHDDHLSGARLRQRVRIGGLLLADVELGGHVARL